jgi:hypothetical protein
VIYLASEHTQLNSDGARSRIASALARELGPHQQPLEVLPHRDWCAMARRLLSTRQDVGRVALQSAWQVGLGSHGGSRLHHAARQYEDASC